MGVTVRLVTVTIVATMGLLGSSVAAADSVPDWQRCFPLEDPGYAGYGDEHPPQRCHALIVTGGYLELGSVRAHFGPRALETYYTERSSRSAGEIARTTWAFFGAPTPLDAPFGQYTIQFEPRPHSGFRAGMHPYWDDRPAPWDAPRPPRLIGYSFDVDLGLVGPGLGDTCRIGFGMLDPTLPYEHAGALEIGAPGNRQSSGAGWVDRNVRLNATLWKGAATGCGGHGPVVTAALQFVSGNTMTFTVDHYTIPVEALP
ncbi:hypothetical protein SIM91_43455 [Rhodococcus opacus]|uniref:hypothetical protein n=1 Tax=Rhodococcus opacus TaxID=37919 RepID=UPI0002A44AE9|nr:hypothetical protein [Rhodococcus opacus]ELB92168.1 hypothetical protein Rwratislav_15498 [Rhodococcus wratislaviensis IFP 2016]MDX5970021.1 hypothetical protein [Rhodococcus opacus]CAG7634726.1 hypothetical protein E143388_07634 [Rhodococcus opacus]